MTPSRCAVRSSSNAGTSWASSARARPACTKTSSIKTLGKLSEHCISNVPWYDPKAALAKAVEGAFKKQNPKDQLRFHALNVGYTFEAILVVADAFKRAGSTEAKTLTEAIRLTEIKNRMMFGGADQVQCQRTGRGQPFGLHPESRPKTCRRLARAGRRSQAGISLARV